MTLTSLARKPNFRSDRRKIMSCVKQLLNHLFLKNNFTTRIAPMNEALGFTLFRSIRRIIDLAVSHRKVFLLIFCCQLFFTLPVFAQSDDDERDNQFRMEVEVSVPLYKGLNVFFDADLRLGKFEKTRFVRPGAGFFYKQKFGKFFTVEPGYRHRTLLEFRGKRESENILFVNGKIKFNIRKFEISQNNLVEFRFRKSNNSQRYRPRLKISHPVKVGKTEIDVFASDEVYYEWKNDAWTRNRFKVGFGKKIGERADYELYYMRQNDSYSKPGDLHIFGIAFKIGTKSPFPVD